MAEEKMNEILENYRRYARELDRFLQQDSGRMIAATSSVLSGIEDSYRNIGYRISYPDEASPSVPIKDIKDKYDAVTKLSNKVKAAQESTGTGTAEFARLMAEYRSQTDEYHSLCADLYKGRLESLSSGLAILIPILPGGKDNPTGQSISLTEANTPVEHSAQIERGKHLLGTYERTLNERRILKESEERSRNLKADVFPTSKFTKRYLDLLNRLEEYKKQEYEEKRIRVAAKEVPLIDGYEKLAKSQGYNVRYSTPVLEEITKEEEDLARKGLTFEQAKRMVSSAEAVTGKRICANLEPYGEKDNADMTAQYTCQVAILVSNLYQHKAQDIYEDKAKLEELYGPSEETIRDEASLQRYLEKIENERKATQMLESAMFSIGLLSIEKKKIWKMHREKERHNRLLHFRPIYD